MKRKYRQWKEPGSFQLVGLYDIHLDPEDDYFHPAYAVARQYVLDVKPKILLFDMGTFDSLSGWNDKKPLIAEGKRYSEDYKVVRDELIFYRHHLPKTRMIYLMGNHEERSISRSVRPTTPTAGTGTCTMRRRLSRSLATTSFTVTFTTGKWRQGMFTTTDGPRPPFQYHV
jgi:hypothetical protein